MFVSAKVHREALYRFAELSGRHEATERDLANKTAVVGFLCARINQLEAERAILLKHALKGAVDIPLPHLSAAVPVTTDAAAALGGLPANMFDDMGDVAAKANGVGWDRTGHVEYDRPRATS